VDHDCRVGDFVHIAVGAHLCGTVTVGDGAFICAGATVINNVSVCEGTTVGAGAVVIGNITETGTYVGVPAKRIM
jgi:serine acetyltransferase